MARIKRGITAHRKHKKLLKLTKGYRMTRHRLVKVAKEAALHAGAYAYHGRKLRKRDMRQLWILRISEATKQEGISYSKFVAGMKKAQIELDRKILAQLISEDPQTFKFIVDRVKQA
ncbi:50S ribosomal protein L20 [Candidatus Microgenomates bacterium]|nr:50S ribosomal protein L20 [Candidatus Microgenomates bacterium]